MTDIRRYGVTRRWADAVVHRGVAYFVEVPDDTQADFPGQVRQVLAQIDHRLAAVGSHRQRLLQVLIYLPDLACLPVLNGLWDAWVPDGHAPARACVQATLGQPACRVEMVITAAVE